MYRNRTSTHDPFTLSLGGLTTIASFTPAPAIAGDRIRRDASRPSDKRKKFRWFNQDGARQAA